LVLDGNRSKALMKNGQSWRDFEEKREMPQQKLIDARIYASREEDHQNTKKKKKKIIKSMNFEMMTYLIIDHTEMTEGHLTDMWW
jgi:hypothetical protein